LQTCPKIYLLCDLFPRRASRLATAASFIAEIGGLRPLHGGDGMGESEQKKRNMEQKWVVDTDFVYYVTPNLNSEIYVVIVQRLIKKGCFKMILKYL